MIDERAPLPASAARVAEDHLRRLDALVPGLVTGMHVVGSAALGDYHDGVSDLDVVAELSREPGDDELAALAEAHTGSGFQVQASYVREGELDGPPEQVADGPWANEGRLRAGERSAELNPVTWLVLARHAISVRGRKPRTPMDVPAAREFCRQNLASYWAPLLDQSAVLLSGRERGSPVLPDPVLWIALGPARPWHTVRTGEVISKTRAGEVAAEHWTDLAEPLAAMVEARAGKPVRLTVEHGEAALELGRRILADVRTCS
ncbi:nucleotidyltransferase domain-containing protein [Gandjariella thermophila]|nr:nucleotidyltransferase domain-containing protein [Gandjariella thermophila]